jgi:hypothetical protein
MRWRHDAVAYYHPVQETPMRIAILLASIAAALTSGVIAQTPPARALPLEKSLPYYRLVYGTAAERPRDSNGRVWFHLARNTRLGLEEASPGQAPAMAHYTGNGIIVEGRVAE